MRNRILIGLLMVGATLLLMLPAQAGTSTGDEDCEDHGYGSETYTPPCETPSVPDDGTTTTSSSSSTVPEETTTTTTAPALTCDQLPDNIPSDSPSYSPNLDQDGDGVACDAPSAAPPAAPQVRQPQFTG